MFEPRVPGVYAIKVSRPSTGATHALQRPGQSVIIGDDVHEDEGGQAAVAGRAGTPNDGGFIPGSDFLMDGGVTATYSYGELAPGGVTAMTVRATTAIPPARR